MGHVFDIPLLADWLKIGEYRQQQTDRNTERENMAHVNWEYQPSDVGQVSTAKSSIHFKYFYLLKISM